MYGMPARKFRVLAGRLVHYEGAFRAAVMAQEQAGGSGPVPATKLMYDMNPDLRGLSTFAEVAKPAELTPDQQAYVDAHPELQAPPRR
jgi:hypothetical protein